MMTSTGPIGQTTPNTTKLERGRPPVQNAKTAATVNMTATVMAEEVTHRNRKALSSK